MPPRQANRINFSQTNAGERAIDPEAYHASNEAPTGKTSPPAKEPSNSQQDAQRRGNVGEDRFRVHMQIDAVVIGLDESEYPGS